MSLRDSFGRARDWRCAIGGFAAMVCLVGAIPANGQMAGDALVVPTPEPPAVELVQWPQEQVPQQGQLPQQQLPQQPQGQLPQQPQGPFQTPGGGQGVFALGDETGQGGITAILDHVKRRSEDLTGGMAMSFGAPPAGWTRHTDMNNPAVSILHPQGWTAYSASSYPSYSEIKVVSPDGMQMVHILRNVSTNQIRPWDVVDTRLAELAGLGAYALVREEQWAVRVSGMFDVEYAFRAVQAGDYTVVIAGSANNMSAAGATVANAGSLVVAGPTKLFTSLAREIYLPMLSSAM
jgi:hypothetical protein